MSKNDSKPRFCIVKRLTDDEIKSYEQLQPNEIEKAIGFILTPAEDGWEKVTYYGKR